MENEKESTSLLSLSTLVVETWIGTVPSLLVKVAKLVSSSDLWSSCVSPIALLERYKDDDKESRKIEMNINPVVDFEDTDAVTTLLPAFDDGCCSRHLVFLLLGFGANPLFIVNDNDGIVSPATLLEDSVEINPKWRY